MTKHIIVDGSNIATEGRTAPSLAQLHEAVLALMKEFPGSKVSVVVDATFGHRIARKEVAEFNKAVEHNELVTPPAGAVGRGDAFVLAIAEKVNGAVLSNDSYQEFHDTHKWLFDPGRLIGGKPVPHVGWVFVARVPVRSGASRRPTRPVKALPADRPSSAEPARAPLVPKIPPPAVRGRAVVDQVADRISNDVVGFLQFVENHPVGAKVKATVSTYAANGMSVKVGDITGYVPLKAISVPPPRSAREVYQIGDTIQLLVTGYTPGRRSVDLGVPGVVAPVPARKAVAPRKSAAPKKAAATRKTTPPRKTAATKKTTAPKKARPVAKSASTSARRPAVAAKAAPRSAEARKKAAPRASSQVSKGPAKAQRSPGTRKSSGAKKKSPGTSRR